MGKFDRYFSRFTSSDLYFVIHTRALQDGTVLNCGDKDVRGERRISYLGSLRLDMEFWDADVQDEYWDGVGRPDSNIMGHCIDNAMITS